MTRASMPLDDLLCQLGETDSDKLKVILEERAASSAAGLRLPLVGSGWHPKVANLGLAVRVDLLARARIRR